MEILYTNCAGLDVHKKTVKVCVMRHLGNGPLQKEFRTYFTTTEELLKLSDWLTEQKCTHIAFEATGVYWKPVFNLLEGNFEVLVVNAQHIKAVPGRKTDVKDAEWIADLLQHGLLKASFIPSGPQRELRDLTRYRVRLTEEKAREVNRVQKTLEDTNVKLGDVVSDIMGKASRMILQAIADGETDPGRLAALAVGRVRADQQQLEAALQGHITDHHRFLLSEHLTQIRHLEEAIERVTAEITRQFTPPEDPAPSQEDGTPDSALQQGSTTSEPVPLSWLQAVILLSSIPGIGVRAAIGILAEIGLNMQQFPSAAHLASWAGVCPGNHESAGKRLSGKTRKGNPWLRCLLVQAAHEEHQRERSLRENGAKMSCPRLEKKTAMRGPKPSHPIALTDAEAEQLHQQICAHSTGQTLAIRARMVLLASEHPEWSNQQIAQTVGTSDRLVHKWRQRWAATRSLADAPRSGAPRRFPPKPVRKQRQWPVVCHRRKEFRWLAGVGANWRVL